MEDELTDKEPFGSGFDASATLRHHSGAENEFIKDRFGELFNDEHGAIAILLRPCEHKLLVVDDEFRSRFPVTNYSSGQRQGFTATTTLCYLLGGPRFELFSE